MRKYQPIWNQLKLHSIAALTAPVTDHRKIIQAVRKEKWRDKGWAYELSLQGKKLQLIHKIENTTITFYLRNYKCSENLGL